MPKTGWGGSVAGTALGTFPSVVDVNVEGLTTNVIVHHQITDATKAGTKVPLDTEEGDVTVTLTHDATTKSLHSQLRTYEGNDTQDTFTITDSLGNTYVGLGFIRKCGGPKLSKNEVMVFQVIVAPVTTWAFAAAA